MTAAGSSAASCDEVARLVAARTGLAFAPARRRAVELGVQRAMARAGLSDLARYHRVLENDPDALDDLIVELTVGETYFFREPGQFDVVRREILPAIVRQRGPAHVLRVWSAGCASGEEAYSLAIVLAEAGLGDRARLVATDISRTALAKARRATYRQWSLRGAEAAAAAPYLRAANNCYVLDARIRERVAVEYLNLALDTYPALTSGIWGMDLILCRNVLIYFDAETIHRVAARLFAALAEGGWLVTGPSDPPLAREAPFETIVTEAGIVYRRPAPPAPSPPAIAPAGRGTVETAPVPLLTAAATPARAASPPGAAPCLLEEARRALAAGDYGRAARVTQTLAADPVASALHVRALANLDAADAERASAAATARHPFAPELHYLRALLLMDLGRDDAAGEALRRVLYLDRSLAAAHFALATVVRRRGDHEEARRSYARARDLCRAGSADALVPFGDGERASRLAEAAETELALLAASGSVA